MKIKADATGLGVDITDSDKEFASKILEVSLTKKEITHKKNKI